MAQAKNLKPDCGGPLCCWSTEATTEADMRGTRRSRGVSMKGVVLRMVSISDMMLLFDWEIGGGLDFDGI